MMHDNIEIFYKILKNNLDASICIENKLKERRFINKIKSLYTKFKYYEFK